MQYDKELRAKSLLTLGEKPKDVAEKTGVAYNKILVLKKEIASERDKERVKEVLTVDPVALDIIVEKAKEEAPASVAHKLDAINEGVKGLQALDTEFHKTFANILRKANKFLDEDGLKPAEWVMITNALSGAYNNIFNNSGVNVHVDNSTQVSNSSLSMFKGSLRG